MLKLTPKTLYTLMLTAEVTAQSDQVFGPGDVFARQAVAELISRQSMAGTVDDYCQVIRRKYLIYFVAE